MSRPLRPGEILKEVLWSLVIMAFVYLIAFLAIETIHKAGTPTREAVEWVFWGTIVVTGASFAALRFPMLAMLCIAVGAALNVRGLYGFDRWPWLVECAGGLLLVVRGFSVGPVPRKA